MSSLTSEIFFGCLAELGLLSKVSMFSSLELSKLFSLQIVNLHQTTWFDVISKDSFFIKERRVTVICVEMQIKPVQSLFTTFYNY